MNYGKKIITRFKSAARWLFNPLVLCCGFIFALWALHYRLQIPLNSPVFTLFGLTAGWLIAFQTNRWNAEKMFLNQLRYEGYKEIQTANNEAQKELMALQNQIGLISSGIALMKIGRGGFEGHAPNLIDRINSFQGKYLELVIALEKNAILFSEIESYKRALFEEQLQFLKDIFAYDAELKKAVIQIGFGKLDLDDLESRSRTANDRCLDLASYFHDFRIELQNHSLGPISGMLIPRRKPNDPAMKTLDQLADANALKKKIESRLTPASNANGQK